MEKNIGAIIIREFNLMEEIRQHITKEQEAVLVLLALLKGGEMIFSIQLPIFRAVKWKAFTVNSPLST